MSSAIEMRSMGELLEMSHKLEAWAAVCVVHTGIPSWGT